VELATGTEFTFELPDKARECFHELIDRNVASSLEFQVVSGGNYDVDVELIGPNETPLYHSERKQYDIFSWTTTHRGEYRFCFSNEFSTFTHKLVYFHFMAGDEDQEKKPVLTGPRQNPEHLTQMEQAALNIRESLTKAEDHQTHYRLREFQGRVFAEEIGTGVFYWSSGVTVAILLVGIAQIVVLRSMFSGDAASRRRQFVIPTGRR